MVKLGQNKNNNYQNNHQLAHLMNKKNTAKSLGISVQAFDKWGVQPVAKIGRESLFDMRSVVTNRLLHAAIK